MIDSDGYRPNVGIVICNGVGQLLWARRYGQNSWQFPQGGINSGETPEQAMYRELYEEVGLKKRDVKILAVTKNWLRYKLPKRMVRWDSLPICIGQKQKWFLLELVSDEKAIDMILSPKPEFDGWKWVSYWYPIRQVVVFKREVYRRALKEFAPIVIPQQALNPNSHFVSPINSFRKRQNRLHSEKLSVHNENRSEITQVVPLDTRIAEENGTDKNSLQKINSFIQVTVSTANTIDISGVNTVETNDNKRDNLRKSTDKIGSKHNVYRRKKRKNNKNQRNNINKNINKSSS